MIRRYESFTLTDTRLFKLQMLNWANLFNICCFLDNQFYPSQQHRYECLAAVGEHKTFVPQQDFFQSLSAFCLQNDDWIFGHFNYDLKNRIENLQSSHDDRIGFAETFLYIPQIVLTITGNQLTIGCFNLQASAIYRQILATPPERINRTKINLKPVFARQEYITIIEQLQQHILKGDCYEINFCQEFFAEDADISPVGLYQELVTESPGPFSAFYKLNHLFLLCASPERYLRKTGNKILSQPIKGTLKRSFGDASNEKSEMLSLYTSKKERSENVMIVDLVRNDLSKICSEGSVAVDELFGIYAFPTLYQMISTISGEIKKDIDLSHILQATFPMGSMTGAPKKKVMELIEQYERTKRGIYSGTVGYITPYKDFDFNVVIRSIMYNDLQKRISCLAGGAITYNSNPEHEYEECLLKLTAIKKVLAGST